MSGSAPGWLDRANGLITLWLARIASAALALIAAVTFVDVVGRYFFQAPLAFSVELTQLAMAIVVYFGVGLVTHEDAHISADVVTLRLSPPVRAAFALVMNLLAGGFVVLMVWRLWQHAQYLRAKGDTMMVWPVPLWPVAYAEAFGSLFLLSGVVLQLLHNLARLRGAEAEAEPPQTTSLRMTE